MKYYICEHCGNIIEYVKESGVPVMCCGQKMTEIVPGTSDGAHEKHVPVVIVDGDKVTVEVGEVEHPSIEKHWIPFVAVKASDLVMRREIKATEKPEAIFPIGDFKGEVEVYAWCNLHGLWKATITL